MTEFGRYALERRIGVGGMAEVWRATLRAHGVEKPLVIKRIQPALSADPSFVEMFTDEARIAMLLHHPNVVQVYDFGELNGEWYMAMEFVQGLNLTRLLAALLRRGRSLSPAQVTYIGHEMCRGLHYAHTLTDPQGRPLHIVHRDVCPANLLVSVRGEVKVADFGIARSVANTFSTQGAGIKGHTAYMSPEQALAAPLDGRSDLFAVGIVLYEALSGRRLFRTDSALTTLEAIREARVPPLQEQAPRVPQALAELVHRALERSPDQRFADARAMQLALAAQLDRSPDALAEELGALAQEAITWDEEDERRRAEAATKRVAEAQEPAQELEATVLARAEPPPALPPAVPPAVQDKVPPETPTGTSHSLLHQGEPPRPARSGRALWLALLLLLPLGMWGLWPSSPEPPLEIPQAPSAQAPSAQAPQPEALPSTAMTEAGPAPQPAQPLPSSPAHSVGDPAPSMPGPASPASPQTPSLPSPAEPTPPAPIEEAPPSPVATAPTAEEEPSIDPNTPATVSITVSQGMAEVHIDGVRQKKSTPLRGLSLPPGTHLVQVEILSTGRVMSRQITVAPGETLDLRFDLD